MCDFLIFAYFLQCACALISNPNPSPVFPIVIFLFTAQNFSDRCAVT